jgi:hypothetical protein
MNVASGHRLESDKEREENRALAFFSPAFLPGTTSNNYSQTGRLY